MFKKGAICCFQFMTLFLCFCVFVVFVFTRKSIDRLITSKRRQRRRRRRRRRRWRPRSFVNSPWRWRPSTEWSRRSRKRKHLTETGTDLLGKSPSRYRDENFWVLVLSRRRRRSPARRPPRSGRSRNGIRRNRWDPPGIGNHSYVYE